MDEELFPKDERSDEPAEGVRIIGAEEAEKAIERDDVARRLPHDAPRYGDRPETPPVEGPRPAIRFPLSGASDPSEIDRPPIVPPDPPAAMPHWTEPATGEVPAILASGEEEDDLDAWSTFSSSQPRWRGEGTDFARDEYDDFSHSMDLVRAGEEVMRAALPEVRKWLVRDTPDTATEPKAQKRPAVAQPAAMPAD